MTAQKDPERTEAKFLHRYAEPAGRRILEIGCGDGRLTWRYAGEARRVAAIDLDPSALRLAALDRPSDLEASVAFARADSIRLPFPGAAFDLAILAWSL